MRVLAIGGDGAARKIDEVLRGAGYAVDPAGAIAEGVAKAAIAPYDAIVLGIREAVDAVKRLRAAGVHAPVLALSAPGMWKTRVAALDAGADDCLDAPFEPEEFLARLRSVIRRKYQAAAGTLTVGDLVLDPASRVVTRGGVVVTLSARELALLEYLMARRGQVVSRADIWSHVYDFSTEPESNVVDVYIGYLRKKLDQGQSVKLIHTRRGQGYVLEVSKSP